MGVDFRSAAADSETVRLRAAPASSTAFREFSGGVDEIEGFDREGESELKAVAVFPRTHRIELVDTPAPDITDEAQVLLRVLDVGVCGTDKEICRFEYGTPPAGSDYLIIGHEMLAEVVDVGSRVERFSPGDLVVPSVRRPCADSLCRACRVGRQDFCTTGNFTERGIQGAHGFLAEFVVEDAQNLHPLPSPLRDIGVLIEPLTIAEKALRQVWDVQQRLPWADPDDEDHGHTALVLGAGPVGLLGAMLLCEAGFDTCVFSREPPGGTKAQLVDAIGARYLSAEDYAVEDLPQAADGFDLVYEACGASGLAFRVLELLAPNAVFVFTGVPGRKVPIEIDAASLMRNLVLKNQIVFGTVNAGRTAFERAVRDLECFRAKWPDAVQSLITGRFGPEDHVELLTGRRPGIKNVITFDATT
jgi:threonine dehydrogenase-like Zn-dependent dehydrogenase